MHRATAPFTVGGKQYPAGSYVFKARAGVPPAPARHVRAAGSSRTTSSIPAARRFRRTTTPAGRSRSRWALKFDRMLEAFDGPFEKIPDVIKPAPGKVTETAGAVGYVVSHQNNDAFIAVNRLLKAGEEVFFVGDRALPERRRHRRHLHHRQADDGGGAGEGGDRSRPELHRR